MRFKDLHPGQFFIFTTEGQLFNGCVYSGMRGPWVKTSPRKYIGHGLVCHVGTVNVLVTLIDRPEVSHV